MPWWEARGAEAIAFDDLKAQILAAAGGGGGPALLTGAGAPTFREIDPLDGTNDPWRWSSLFGGWIGPAVTVSWSAGAVVPSLTALPDNAEQVDLYVGPLATLEDASAWPPLPGWFTHPNVQSDGSVNGDPVPTTSSTIRRTFPTLTITPPLTAPSDGTGIAFLVQYEEGHAGPTAVPDKTLDATALLGDVTVTGPYEIPFGAGDGELGDYWRDEDTGDVYGPKRSWGWGEPIGRFFDPSGTPVDFTWDGATYQPAALLGATGARPKRFAGPTDPTLVPGVGLDRYDQWDDLVVGTAGAHYTGFGPNPALTAQSDDGSYTLATAFRTARSGQEATGGRFWIDGSRDQGQVNHLLGFRLYAQDPNTRLPTGAPLAAVNTTANQFPAAGGTGYWAEAAFPAPVPLTPGAIYYVAASVAGGQLYSAMPGSFNATIDAPSGAAGLSFPGNTVTGNGAYYQGGDGTPNAGSGNGAFYGVDVTVRDTQGASTRTEYAWDGTDWVSAATGATGSNAETVTIDGASEPADSDLGDSQAAIWYEPTASAPVVHFKAKDSTGAVYVASLPMTAA